MIFTMDDAYTFCRKVVDSGDCSTTAVYAKINEAVRRLIPTVNTSRMLATIRMGVRNSEFALPREAEKVLAHDANGVPGTVFGRPYQFLHNGPGDFAYNRLGDRSTNQLASLGEHPYMFPLPDLKQNGTKTVVTSTPVTSITNVGETWAPTGSSLAWTSIAVSSDGKYQTAVADTEYIYVSADYGDTWAAKDSARDWVAVAISDNGKYQSAATATGQLYVSADYGATWAAKDSARAWRSIAVSANGKYQTAGVLSGNIYTSADYGATWAAKASAQSWSGISMSSSGEYQAAAVSTSGKVYASYDYGDTWAATAVPTGNWQDVAMSSGGEYWTAVARGGQVYVSADRGVTWAAKDSARSWVSVSMSSDGKYQIATVSAGSIYVSADYGSTWSAKDSVRAWKDVSVSRDGMYQAAAVTSGQLYVAESSEVTTSTTTTSEVAAEYPLGFRLYAFSTEAADAGVEITVRGFGLLAEQLRDGTNVGITFKINRFDGGVEGTIKGAWSTLYNSGDQRFRDIEQVHKPVTAGYVTIYAVYPEENRMWLVGKYHPDETLPVFTRYRITSKSYNNTTPSCTNLLMLVKMRYVPLTRAADVIPLDSLDAIKNMVMAIGYEDARDLQNAVLFEQNAIRLLNNEAGQKDTTVSPPMVIDVTRELSGRYCRSRQGFQ